MTTDEYTAKIFEADGVIGDILRRFLKEKLHSEIPKYLKHRYCVGCFRFLELCTKHSFSIPCQKLYDLALADRKKANFYCILQLIKFIDAEFQTHAVDCLTKLPFNDSFNQSDGECDTFFANAKVPLTQAPVGFVITKAMRGLVLFENSPSTKGQYLRMFRLLAGYCRIHNNGYCSKELAYEFVSKAEKLFREKKIHFWRLKLVRRVAMVTEEILKTGSYSKWYLAKKTPVMPGGLEEVRRLIREHCCYKEKSMYASASLDYSFRKFIEMTGIRSAEELKKCTPKQTVAAIAKLNSCFTNTSSINTVAGHIKKVLGIMFKGGFTTHDLSNSVIRQRHIKDNVIPYLTDEDEKKLIAWLEAGNESRRTTALILLALRLGMRDSDICALRFKNIDWEKEKISFIQQKTGEPQTLPLLPEVGNAIWDYISEERPNVNCQYIFLRMQAPYQQLVHSYNPVSCTLKKLKITPKHRNNFGAHILRHTMVKNLLHTKIPHQHITDILGHQSHSSDRSYYAISEEKLRECALDLSIIGIPAWMKEI